MMHINVDSLQRLYKVLYKKSSGVAVKRASKCAIKSKIMSNQQLT